MALIKSRWSDLVVDDIPFALPLSSIVWFLLTCLCLLLGPGAIVVPFLDGVVGVAWFLSVAHHSITLHSHLYRPINDSEPRPCELVCYHETKTMICTWTDHFIL